MNTKIMMIIGLLICVGNGVHAETPQPYVMRV